MRKFIWTVAAIGLAAAPAANAEPASEQEMLGVGTGSVIGAIAGGPFGLVIGAAIGAKIGDNFAKKNEEISGLELSLEGSQDTVRHLEGDDGHPGAYDRSGRGNHEVHRLHAAPGGSEVAGSRPRC